MNLSWHERNEAKAAHVRRQFYRHAGPEVPLFEAGMEIIEDALAIEPRPIQARICRIIIGMAYQLIISSWNDLAEGRLSSATGHQRSIWEAYEYAGAAAVSEQFANRWLEASRQERTVSIEVARRAIRDSLESETPGRGREWVRDNAREAKRHQATSHVSIQAAMGILDFDAMAAREPFFQPSGSYSQTMIRAQAAMTGFLLARLHGAALAGLHLHMPPELIRRMTHFVDEAMPEFARIASERSLAGGAMAQTYFAAGK